MKEVIMKLVDTPSPHSLGAERFWVMDKLREIGKEKLDELLKNAVSARENAYAPYSNYKVGASILCESGEIYNGCNTEVVTYSQTGHAEGNAINQAIIGGEGKEERKFIKAVVCCGSGVSGPCGACRQEIIEHCDNAVYICVNQEGEPTLITSMKVLFPYAFTPSHLE